MRDKKDDPHTCPDFRGPVRLGPFAVSTPLILAPMAAITTSPYRRLMRRWGCPIVVTDLVSAEGLIRGSERSLKMLQFHPEERPIGAQIFGEKKESMVSAARILQDLGFDFVDINLGCPVDKVTKKGAGAALCKEPVKLAEMLSAIKNSIKIPLTIKIRTGWDFESRNAHDIVRLAYESGVSWVAIHGRTRAQGYSGSSDWDYIGEIKAQARIPIIGNGDVLTARQAMERLEQTGVDAVMIGRGALRNPFIFSDFSFDNTKEAESSDRFLKMISDLKIILSESQNDHFATLGIRKFLAWFSTGFEGCHEYRKELFSLSGFSEVFKISEVFFSSSFRKRNYSDFEGGFLMGGHG